MSNLQIFKNSEFGEIRTITKDGEPWFVGKDVATVLQYANTSKAINDHVDSDDLTNRYPIIDSMGRTQEVSLINESGLYSLIFSSKLPKAKEFKHWVTSEVLPSIRKTGTYSVNAYHPKSTSLGEVASFIKVMRSLMKENNQSPEKIAEMAESVCKQFNVNIPDDFVKRNPFQMIINANFFLAGK